MSDQDSTKKEGSYPEVPSAHKDVASDIENALSFIDSQEYGAVSPPGARKKPASSPETGDVEPIPEESLKTAAEEDGHVPVPRKIEKEPQQKPFFPPEDAQEKSGSKSWIIFVVAAIPIVLAIFFLL